MKTIFLLGLLSFFCSALSGATIDWKYVYWKSGKIKMPNGTFAGDGDVIGYAIICQNLGMMSEMFSESSSFYYSQIHQGNVPHGPQNFGYAVSGVSNSKGEINLTDEIGFQRYANEWAVVVYKCIVDGYEYYMRVNAWHYETSSILNDVLDSNLASITAWEKVYACPIPEPSTASMFLCGVVLVLRRRLCPKVNLNS